MKRFLEKFNRIIREISFYSSFDFEIYFRELFESSYTILSDFKHTSWKERLKYYSLFTEDNVLFSNNYWENLIFSIFSLHCKNYSIYKLKYLDLEIRNINWKTQKDIFQKLAIEVSISCLERISHSRYVNYGDFFVEINEERWW